MKRFENIFRTFLALSVCLLCGMRPTVMQAQDASRMDSVEIGLITCSPHEEIYSLYGHAALRVHDLKSELDIVYNYGIFNYKTPHFAWRFMMGETDYELGKSAFYPFCNYYKDWGSQVIEQVLDLTSEEKVRIIQALETNALPQNCVYRYNFFYDNCSTRPRDIIEKNILGKIIYDERQDFTPTYREMIHEHTKNHPWAAFGNDLLLGFKADKKTTQREQEFLPENLRYDFDRAVVLRNGQQRPLVLRHVEHVAPGVQMIKQDFPIAPLVCGLILLGFSLLLFFYELKRGRALVWWDALLMLLTGLPGCILALMFFSEHPTTSTNLQILILNPLSLVFIPQVVRRRKTRWFKISLVLTIAFLVGGFVQDYAEGMECVALCLLLRYWIHRHDK